ncbi:hypothetical protein FA13DRAFT_1716379 [Coprinellus micaceus]|uniref:Uncharacterized protein n=1 Tax=Coprinellus micaceus TaxID=71717 RepID=A0A4Y7SJJ1_COPMI|nr:hypothetical protein FA13DRAFT_1716379 [Coprinellus micaceus]
MSLSIQQGLRDGTLSIESPRFLRGSHRAITGSAAYESYAPYSSYLGNVRSSGKRRAIRGGGHRGVALGYLPGVGVSKSQSARRHRACFPASSWSSKALLRRSCVTPMCREAVEMEGKWENAQSIAKGNLWVSAVSLVVNLPVDALAFRDYYLLPQMPNSTKRGGTSGSTAEGSRRSERMAGKRKRDDEKRSERDAEETEAQESEAQESDAEGWEAQEWEAEDGDESEEEYRPTKKAKTGKGKGKAKAKAVKPMKNTADKSRAKKNVKGSASQASTSGSDSALKKARSQFKVSSRVSRLVYVRAGGSGNWVPGQVASVYALAGTVTVNWYPRLKDGKYDRENPHADHLRNVQTEEEYLAGLTEEESGSGRR